MIRIAFCALALFGFGNLVWADSNGQDSHPKTSQEPSASTTPPTHYPSSGLTLETLKALPPTQDSWYPGGSANRGWVYQPYSYGGLYPYYSFNYPYNSYVYPYGIGGYYPPRVGGSYQSVLGWWLW
ncbi:MAG: hypothetical protein JWO38_6916 [Gemmataceae bacterium]|nr:hypothetical protein [Gemmataceae bacterium]